MELFTNKQLAKISGYPYSKIRRYAKEVLPPDEKATQQSGFARMYSEQDAFTIVLYGHLISVLNLSASDAKRVIDDLKGWIASKGLFPGIADDSALITSWREYEIFLFRSTTGFHYVARGIIDRSAVEGEPVPTFICKYTEETLSTQGEVDITNVRIFKISDLEDRFRKARQAERDKRYAERYGKSKRRRKLRGMRQQRERRTPLEEIDDDEQ